MTKDETSDKDLHRVISRDELSDGDRVVAEINGREIALFCVDGEIHALANYCVHQGGPVCEGQISGALLEEDGELTWEREGEIVNCPWHGWEFDIRSGEHISNKRYKLPTYDVVVDDDEIYIAF